MARNLLFPPSVKPGIPKLGGKPNGWTTTTFGDVLQVMARKANINDSQKYQLVTAKRNRGGIVPRSILLGKDILTKTQFYIKSGDFLISKRQIVHGACGVVPPELDGALVSNEYAVLRAKEDLLIEYLSYFSYTIYFQQTCFQSSVGVAVEKMIFDLKEWLKYSLHLPPFAEQEAIVKALGTWDKAIALTEQLIAAKQKRKRALMQQLLKGKRRFREFEGKTWQETLLGDVAELMAGGTPSTKIESYWGGEIRWMRSGDVHRKRIYDVEGRITQAGLDNSNAQLIPRNSVLIALAGQGKTRGTVAINKIELTTNQSVAAIIPDSGLLCSEYLFYDLDARYYELRCLSSGEGGRGGLNLNLLRSIRVAVPPMEEQRKIANVLQICDTEIDLLTQKLDALQRQKNGLMQQLLTGRVRVKV